MGIHSPLADGITIPFDFGLPQFFILLIGLCGLALLIWVVLGLTRGSRDKFGERRRRFFWGRAVSGSVMLLVAISLLYLAILLQTYVGLTSEILVARIHATSLANIADFMTWMSPSITSTATSPIARSMASVATNGNCKATSCASRFGQPAGHAYRLQADPPGRAL